MPDILKLRFPHQSRVAQQQYLRSFWRGNGPKQKPAPSEKTAQKTNARTKMVMTHMTRPPTKIHAENETGGRRGAGTRKWPSGQTTKMYLFELRQATPQATGGTYFPRPHFPRRLKVYENKHHVATLFPKSVWFVGMQGVFSLVAVAPKFGQSLQPLHSLLLGKRKRAAAR